MSLSSLISLCFRPHFLFTRGRAPGPPGFLSYSRLWVLCIVLLAAVSLVPLSILTLLDYELTEQAMQSEHTLRTVRVTSNTRRTLSYFLEERLDALLFTMQEKSLDSLGNQAQLAQVLLNLQVGFGGFVDLGLIDSNGRQVNYAGPFDLEGKDYSGQPWFDTVREQGLHISGVFMGYRDEPHISVAVRSTMSGGKFFILRGTLDFKRLQDMLKSLEIGENGDAFLINREGLLQTDSAFFGKRLEGRLSPVPPLAEHTSHYEIVYNGKSTLLSYAYIKNSPFILCIAKVKDEAMKAWLDLRADRMWWFFVSIASILVVVYIISTGMMNAIYDANIRQTKTMEQMEQSSRLASIGQLAAGVAHEVNNPLAVIAERAGLIRDMLTMAPEKRSEQKLIENIDVVLDTVDRCGKITRQLLNFSRKMDVDVEKFPVQEVIGEVLSFLNKEASYRNIEVRVDHEHDLPEIISDRGKVQQILLNLANNAFQAMPEGGSLSISTRMAADGEGVEVAIADTGIGISKENLKHIFEPFFTTRLKTGGTGLGLSICYGLARKLNGNLSVTSEIGKGTAFTVHLPLEIEQEI